MTKKAERGITVKLKFHGKDAETFLSAVAAINKKSIGYGTVQLDTEQSELFKWINDKFKGV